MAVPPGREYERDGSFRSLGKKLFLNLMVRLSGSGLSDTIRNFIQRGGEMSLAVNF